MYFLIKYIVGNKEKNMVKMKSEKWKMENGKWKMENEIFIEPTRCVNSVLSRYFPHVRIEHP